MRNLGYEGDWSVESVNALFLMIQYTLPMTRKGSFEEHCNLSVSEYEGSHAFDPGMQDSLFSIDPFIASRGSMIMIDTHLRSDLLANELMNLVLYANTV